MSTVLVRMRVKPEAEAEFLRILHDVTQATIDHEPDCLVYATWATGQPHEYLMIESYRSEAGRTLHNERHRAVAPAFFATLAEPPQVEQLGVTIAANPAI